MTILLRWGGFTVTNGNNSFTAIASDNYGRRDTNSVSVNLPATATAQRLLEHKRALQGRRR